MKEGIIYKAEELYKLGYNSSQAVCAAFADYYKIDRDTALMMASSFGHGTSRLKGMCGAADALVILSGFEKKNIFPNDPELRDENYEMVQKLIEEFRKRNGSVLCTDLRDCERSNCDRRRNCLDLVKGAVEIYADYIGLK